MLLLRFYLHFQRRILEGNLFEHSTYSCQNVAYVILWVFALVNFSIFLEYKSDLERLLIYILTHFQQLYMYVDRFCPIIIDLRHITY